MDSSPGTAAPGVVRYTQDAFCIIHEMPSVTWDLVLLSRPRVAGYMRRNTIEA